MERKRGQRTQATRREKSRTRWKSKLTKSKKKKILIRLDFWISKLLLKHWAKENTWSTAHSHSPVPLRHPFSTKVCCVFKGLKKTFKFFFLFVCVRVCVWVGVFGYRVPYNKTICIHTGRVNTTCSCPGSSVLVISARTELCPSGTSLFPQSPLAQTQNESWEKAGQKDRGKRLYTVLRLASTWPKTSFCVLITLVKSVFLSVPCSQGCLPFLKTTLFNESEFKSGTMRLFFLLRASLSRCYAQWHTPLLQLCVPTSTHIPTLVKIQYILPPQPLISANCWGIRLELLQVQLGPMLASILILNDLNLAALVYLINSHAPCTFSKIFWKKKKDIE